MWLGWARAPAGVRGWWAAVPGLGWSSWAGAGCAACTETAPCPAVPASHPLPQQASQASQPYLSPSRVLALADAPPLLRCPATAGEDVQAAEEGALQRGAAAGGGGAGGAARAAALLAVGAAPEPDVPPLHAAGGGERGGAAHGALRVPCALGCGVATGWACWACRAMTWQNPSSRLVLLVGELLVLLPLASACPVLRWSADVRG